MRWEEKTRERTVVCVPKLGWSRHQILILESKGSSSNLLHLIHLFAAATTTIRFGKI